MSEPDNRLTPEDQERVDKVVNSGIHATPRKPFNPWRLMLWLSVIIVGLGVLSRVIGFFALP